MYLSKKFFCIFLSFLLTIESLFAQKHLSPSEELELFFSNNQIETQREPLSFTGNDTFPFNLLLKTNPSLPQKDRNIILIDILQQDALAYRNELLEMIKAIDNNRVQSIFLFSTTDSQLPQTDYPTSGTQIFTSNYDKAEYTTAMVIDFKNTDNVLIKNGGFRSITPKWLAQKTVDALIKTDTPFKMNNLFLSLFRLGIIKTDKRFSSYAESSIPAISLTMNGSSSLKAISQFINDYDVTDTMEWDNHYLFLNIPLKPLWIGERVLITLLMLIGFVILFLICYFSFIGKLKEHKKHLIRKTWYMIPLTLGVSFVSLFSGQFIAYIFSLGLTLSPIYLFGIKIFFTIITLSALFAMQEHLKINVDSFFYGYILTISSIFNIFVFSFIDLMLIFVFFVEYLIIYISRAVSKAKYLSVALVFMLIPFVPYLVAIFINGDENEIIKLTFSSAKLNLLFTIGLFPFQIMWLRLLLKFDNYRKEKGLSSKKLVINVASLTLSALILFNLILFGISSIVEKRRNIIHSQKYDVSKAEDSCIETSYSKEFFSGLITHHLTIISKQDALRYRISLPAENSVKIIDSLYDYKISEDTGDTIFLVPDYPPHKITVDFTTEDDAPLKCNIDAYFQQSESEAIIQTEYLTINGEDH